MFFELFLGSGGDLFGDVGPVSKSSGFGGFYQKKFLVGTPVGMYDGQGTLLDDTVWMPGMFCSVLRKAYSQHPSLSWVCTLYTQVILLALWGCTAYAGRASYVD
jgi:hypothetical protein